MQELRRMIFVVSIFLCLILVSTLLFSISSNGEGSNDRYSIIIVSTLFESRAEEEKALYFYDHLIDEGYDSERIDFLAYDNTTNSDRISNVSNIEDSFDSLINNSDPNKEIVIYIADHEQGTRGNSYFEFVDGNISSSTLDGWMDEISCSELTVILLGNRSGLSGDTLSDINRLVMSSMRYDETNYPDHFNITRSLKDPLSDSDGDGEVSFEEAFWKERDLIMGSGQTPCIWN